MTDLELAALELKISQAETEYHALVTGNKPRVFVDQNGERVEFVAANRGVLLQYIQSLKSQLPDAEVFGYVQPIRYLF